MRSFNPAGLLSSCLILWLLSISVFAKPALGEAAKLLPNKIGEAAAQGKVSPAGAGSFAEEVKTVAEIKSAASRFYATPSGEKYAVTVFRTRSDSEAYSLLTFERSMLKGRPGLPASKVADVGTDAHAYPGQIVFFKGAIVAFIKDGNSVDELLEGQAARPEAAPELLSFARKFAETLDAGTGELPPLVNHLPDWEAAQGNGAFYILTQSALRQAVPNQPVLETLPFESGTEAVTATYEQGARLVIVEYATPQIAFDADAAIKTHIAALRAEGKPAPSAYRRVGNYSVFVFDAPNEQAATGLIGKITYEKEVRWLGENPYAVERANRAWLNMSTSVIVNTVKATGLAIVICLSIGGVFGGWIFMRRRAQAALTEKFSDAGGLLRLNIDEMSAQNNTAHLIGQGDKAG